MTEPQRSTHVAALIQEFCDGLDFPPSERAMAAYVGVSPNTFNGWARGKVRPKPENVDRLADLLRVPKQRVRDAMIADLGLGPDEHVATRHAV